MLDNRERELKAEDGEESKFVDGISEELNVLGTKSDTEMVSEEGQCHDNIGKEEVDLVMGYTKDTTLGDESWESAITVPEPTLQVMIEKRFLATLHRFTGGEGSKPWGMLNKFQKICWKRKRQDGVSDEIFQMITFPFCLSGDAPNWFMSIAPGSFRSWLEVGMAFLRRYVDREELEAPMEAFFNWSMAKAKWKKADFPNEEDMPTLTAG